MSPFLPLKKASLTKLTESSNDIKNLVIDGSVSVRISFFFILLIKKGMRLPLENITLPYLVIQIEVFIFFNSFSLALAIATFSIIAFEIPIALMGYTALSVLKITIFLTLFSIDASIIFDVPNTLVL